MVALAAIMCAGAVAIASLSDRLERRRDTGREIAPADGDRFDHAVKPLVHPTRAAR